MTLRVAVIGGGCSGTLVAAELMRRAKEPVSVAVVEAERTLGRGLAYGTPSAVHLLNVPAGAMSAYADDPGHFLRWVQRRDAEAHEGSFVPRVLYGRYLEETLAEAAAGAPAGSRLDHVQDRALSIWPVSPGGLVQLASGASRLADRVVLTLGHAPPAFLAGRSRGGADPELFVTDPWAPGALDLAKGDRSVLVIGTGLTAVDVIIALRHRGHGGPIHAVSRHGLLPRTHAAASKAGGPSAFTPSWGSLPSTALGLLRHVRAAARGREWRPVVDSLRGHSHEIWRSLSLRERRRFLRHLRPYWDVLRHRTPAEVGHVIEGMIRCGRLQVTAGRVAAFAHDTGGVRATVIARRTGARADLVVGHVIDCTGPTPPSVRDPLLRDLLRDGEARLGPLGLGLEAADDGALVAADGRPSPWLFAVGPLLKGTLWETTSVAEIRIQAAAAASALLPQRVLYPTMPIA